MSWSSFKPAVDGHQSRRQRLAAMAATAYRAGASAVGEIRETYATSREAFTYDIDDVTHMPGAFPDADIVTQGREHMIVLPTYAKKHSKLISRVRYNEDGEPDGEDREEQWIIDWENSAMQDAIVDVDVRGWLYTPEKPPLPKRMRLMVALARSMSGIPSMRQDEDEDGSPMDRNVARRPSDTPVMPPRRATTSSSNGSTTPMSQEEIAAANQTLMKRISPFLTTPLFRMPVTVFFYDNDQSQSRTFYTDESGHFMARVALNFIPTNVRVLVDEHMTNSSLSKRVDVRMLAPHGISIISDIDDTVKYSNVTGGSKEILRNTFVRDLETMKLEGVAEWYQSMERLGVDFHYVSNSPWQVYPILTTFWKLSGLPLGSMHLKQYNGMLQGVWESAADRKRPSLDRLIKDFPDRRFILVGDSGEADLQLYTELALQYPKNILGIFIRDITTPDNTQDALRLGLTRTTSDMLLRPGLPPRASSASPSTRGNSPPVPPPSRAAKKEELLIDFSDDTPATPPPASVASTDTDDSSQKPKPPRPNKPVALRGAPPVVARKPVSLQSQAITASSPPSINTPPPVPLKTRPSMPSLPSTPKIEEPTSAFVRTPPPAPPPRRRAVSSTTPTASTPGPDTIASHIPKPHLAPTLAPVAAMSNAAAAAAGESLTGTASTTTPAAIARKVEAWQNTLREAKWKLEKLGVPLFIWRRGGDAMEDALELIRKAGRE